jgi:hypothetical protein
MELLATLVLGILALVQLRRSPGRYRGYSLAIVALLMCPFMFVLFVAGSWRLARLEARSRVHLDAATAVLASEPLLPEPNVLPPEITAPPTPVAPAFPPPIGWTADAGDSLPPAITDIVNQVRGLLPPGTVFYPPKYGPGGEIPAFLRSVVECTLPAGDSASNYWFDLDTGGSLAEANNHLDDDEQARQSRIRTGFDVGAVLNGAQSGLAGFDLAAMRVSDIEWSAATLLGDLGPMSAAQPEGHVFMGMSSNGPSTFFFKTRWGRLGILQITGLSSNPPGVNFHYKLVEPATNSGSDTPGPGSPPPAVPQSEVQPLAHANLRARFNAAAGIVSFSDRDTAMAELATDAARLGDAVVVKQALGRITSFSSRDDAAAASAREFLKQSRRASALDAAQSITSFSTRDEVLAEAAKDSARAGDAALVKDSLRRITSFSTRDDAAVESGRLLVKAGLRSDALEVARTITSFSLRDEALGELAK